MGDDDADVDGLLADLTRYASEQRVDDAVRARTRERWLRHQAAEVGTMAGVAHDLAERGVDVALHTTDGRTQRGRVTAAGRDFVAITDSRQTTFVPSSAIAWLRPEPADSIGGAPGVRGDSAADITLADVLAGLAGDRVHVIIGTGTESVAGELTAVGADVLTVVTDGGPRRAAVYVALDSVSAVSVLVSG